jgi:hypothetical protein
MPKTLTEKRREAGRKGGLNKRGKKTVKTIQKEIALERIKQTIFGMADKLVMAQTVPALGTYKMIRPFIGEDGLPHTETIRDMDRMQELIDTGVHGKDYLIVAGDKPDHKAVSALLDRAFGKPVESVEHSGRDGKPLIIKLDS